MKHCDSPAQIADKIDARLRKRGIKLTIGGEPSYVPVAPDGPEWSITALGPTKLRHAYAFAGELIRHAIPHAVAILSPGKSYPGELNPRWALNLLWNRNEAPLHTKPVSDAAPTPAAIRHWEEEMIARLKVADRWLDARDPSEETRCVRVLPLDHDGGRWITDDWPRPADDKLTLVGTEGSAGLRLPLSSLPRQSLRRALVIETKQKALHVFLPPLLQAPFVELLGLVTEALHIAGIGHYFLESYIPHDDAGAWSQLCLSPDPGVLEVNLPPCSSAHDYGRWMEVLATCAASAGLRSFKQHADTAVAGTGGGNHILFGGPDLEENPFFRHPGWITSILRYWQRHPSLAYLFTSEYVGPSSQAPRPDESSRELYDLEMAYRFLEKLKPGRDQRHLISETLRHLHTDASGNAHRSEISFDKFWNTAFEGGCRGLIEFRALEMLPRPEWMTHVGLLWQALAVFLFEKRCTSCLVAHGHKLHDAFFLPTLLWEDFEGVLGDLRGAGFDFGREIFRAIWQGRFPSMLAFEEGAARLVVRKACEGWPLLCEAPLEGGMTSRFVDTSMERLEFVASRAFARMHRVFVQGRALKLAPFARGQFGAGLRFRRSALYPSLHPGIAPHMPLFVTIVRGRVSKSYVLENDARAFRQCEPGKAPRPGRRACRKLHPSLLTCDLRLP
jgi:uncharacterized protein (DUF2126 family)